MCFYMRWSPPTKFSWHFLSARIKCENEYETTNKNRKKMQCNGSYLFTNWNLQWQWQMNELSQAYRFRSFTLFTHFCCYCCCWWWCCFYHIIQWCAMGMIAATLHQLKRTHSLHKILSLSMNSTVMNMFTASQPGSFFLPLSLSLSHTFMHSWQPIK